MDIIKLGIMAYEFMGMAVTVLFIKILDMASSRLGEGEITDINNELKEFMSGLTPIQKLVWFIWSSIIWLPAVIVLLIKLRTGKD